MFVRVVLGVAIGVVCFGLTACDESLSDLAGPTPNLTPTLSSIQREIFETTDSSGRQMCVSCHRPPGSQFAGGLDLTASAAYTNLVGRASALKPGAVRVVPGDPESSYLIHKLEGRTGIVGQRMPRGSGPFLTEGQMLVIKRWIELGARND